MNFLDIIYQNRLAENESNLRFWEDYLHRLQALDFNVFAEQLKVPALVPIGSRILFRGQITHTNEITVALGQDYFAKCSVKQAEELKQRRIKDAQSKVDEFRKERQYFESHISFSKENVSDNIEHEIIEPYNEEEEKKWQIKHRENMRQYKQNSRSKEILPEQEIDDEELWNKLDELELQEDLENELQNVTSKDHSASFKNINIHDKSSSKQEVTQEIGQNKDEISEELRNKLLSETTEHNFKAKNSLKIETVKRESQSKKDAIREKYTQEAEQQKNDIMEKFERLNTSTGLDIKMKVMEKLDKSNELEIELQEAKDSRTVQELISRLDKMEELDDLEDDMNRFHDILDIESSEGTEDDIGESTKLHSRVSFADEDDAETIDITFSHSDNEPSIHPFNTDSGIQNPRDIYEAYPNLFIETKSILKKSKYQTPVNTVVPKAPAKWLQQEEHDTSSDREIRGETRSLEICGETRTILVNDVTEKSNDVQAKVDTARPTSLFKQRRQMKKP